MDTGVKRALLAVLTLASLAVLFFVTPIPQPAGYHQFTDQRTILGVPHFMDVASNLPFLVAGLVGFYNAVAGKGLYYPDPAARGPWTLLGLAVSLTAFGSAYYHWAPSDAALFWDRLPMAIAFSAVLGILVMERVDRKIGALLWVPLVIAGIWSLVYWRTHNDLRFYGLLQGWAMVLTPVILLLFPAPCTGTRWLWLACGLYGLAKGFELLDAPIFALTRGISGHTLKHLAAGAGSWYFFVHLRRRRPL
jgi:hypothetical protein